MSSKLFSKVNLPFFIISVIGPLTLFFVFVIISFFIFIFPYMGFKVSRVFENPAVPVSFKKASGFEAFSFFELSKEASNSVSVKNIPATFSLTIPKLKIDRARVQTNSTSLSPDNILGHYNGTSLPGEEGNALIYGHSVLPIFFNIHDYKTIFSTLSLLTKNDTFYVDFAGETFSYEVVEKLTLKPEEVKVFKQQSTSISESESTVTLLTCVPPGSKLYRLLVIGKLKR